MKSSEISRQSLPSALRVARSLKGIASAILVGVALASGSMSATAGTNGLEPTVKSLVPLEEGSSTVRPISYSVVNGNTYQAAYAVRIANPTSSNVSNAIMKLVTSVSNGSPAPFKVPVEGLASGNVCTADQAGTTLICQFTTLASNSVVEFTLLVQSPTPTSGADSILSIAWDIQAGQGVPNDSTLVSNGSEDVTLQVGNAKLGVQSYVEAFDSLAVTDAGSTTGVKPPKPVTVGVTQITVPNSCSPLYKKCLRSTIRIVDVVTQDVVNFQLIAGTPMVIDLVRSKATLKPKSDINNAILSYAPAPNETPLEIAKCVPGLATDLATVEGWRIPDPIDLTGYAQGRCVVPASPPNAFTKVDASGNWLFRILAWTNGSVDW